MADDSVQPVPWVLRVAMRGTASRVTDAPSNRKSVLTAPVPWPPLISTALAPSARIRSACACISVSSAAISVSSKAAASGRLGVTTRARPRSSRRSVAIASGASSLSPEVATITGSSTTFVGFQRSSPAATASITPARASMPIFTAPTARSENTASICAVTKAGGTSWIAVTPRVFCAVSAVMTDAP